MAVSVPIISRVTAGAPKDYTVPGSQAIKPLSVRADIDGSGTAAAWLPALQLLAPDGTVMWTAVDRNNPVAAGASADVSWFPHVAATAASGSLSPDWGTYFTGGGSVPSNGHTAFDLTFNTGSALLDLTTPSAPTFVSRGVYAVTAWIQSTDTWTADSVAGGRLAFGTPTSYSQRSTGTASGAGVVRNFSIELTAQVDAGGSLGLEFENFDSSARAMFSNQMLVQLIGTY